MSNYSFKLGTVSKSKALPSDLVPYWDLSEYEFMYALIIQ